MKYSFLLVVLFFFSNFIIAQTANRYDILITEFMADPTPAVGLPNNEWIELKNVSAATINLQSWKIGDATGLSGNMPAYNLKPDSFIIVCSSGSLAAMSVFGPTISVTSFPSLDNGGDILYLRSAQNKTIHSLNYSDKWYGNELKADGGWTLEMTDTKNPCSGSSNWKASVDPKGGTPGKANSINAVNADKDDPYLLKAFAKDSLNITLVFSEIIDSAKAAIISNYQISDGIGTPASVSVAAPLFDHVLLKLNSALQRNKIYTVNANGVMDCSGNTIGAKKTALVGLSSRADSFDVVINEILFNPKPNGVDYVEVYNRSEKIVDLKNVFIANRNSLGSISSIYPLSIEERLLFPGEYALITTDANVIKRDYISGLDAFCELTSTPSFNDDEGDVIILNEQGRIVDELKYSEKWHFKLIDNAEGVSLERIDCNAATQAEPNWHSAATSAGYGTPGYKNSQYHAGPDVKGEVSLAPGIVSPDNDGMDDFATLDYEFPSPGYVANIVIFDASGRPVRYLQRNALCGIKGYYRWDGLSENGQKLPVGLYIFLTEIFNLEGKKKHFKNSIVLARK
jgi:hypothetical protein